MSSMISQSELSPNDFDMEIGMLCCYVQLSEIEVLESTRLLSFEIAWNIENLVLVNFFNILKHWVVVCGSHVDCVLTLINIGSLGAGLTGKRILNPA